MELRIFLTSCIFAETFLHDCDALLRIYLQEEGEPLTFIFSMSNGFSLILSSPCSSFRLNVILLHYWMNTRLPIVMSFPVSFL